jgi:hypothetical protein
MLKPAGIALSIGALIYGFGGQAAQGGWIDAGSGLSLGASSLVISVKKHKNNDDHDGKNHKSSNKGKHKHDDKQEAGEDSTASGGNSGSSSGGIKPIDDVPPATLLLPYFECDLSKQESCSSTKH